MKFSFFSVLLGGFVLATGCSLVLGNDGDFTLAVADASTGDGAAADAALDARGADGAVDAGFCAADSVACGTRSACLAPGTTGRQCAPGLTCSSGSCLDCRAEATTCGEVLPSGCGAGNVRGTKCTTAGTTCCPNGQNRNTCQPSC